ncbi:IPP transferase-domain-containing protein [Dichotomopilus funicola]|uniref:tRNA dimethylallyltransferase n=1 Tax=Dichotomopilus funicola TaxID=1934379 RepID=A0AAN6V0J6_9PEZI|nr:IPP transferase-domain-containing protein [Dichotomopilus funicola]
MGLFRLASLVRAVLRPSKFTVRRMKPLICIYGSTGTGKSDLAVELAKRYDGEIINADAMQMYDGLPIITNKISIQEQRGITHHLLGSIELRENPWAASHFKNEATKIIWDIRSRGKLPILVGGTSYYLDGLIFDGKLVKEQAERDGRKVDRDDLIAQHPILSDTSQAMWEKLREVDPVMAEKWHPNDTRKIRTSLEIYYGTGRRASDIYAEQRREKESKWAVQSHGPNQNFDEILMFWLYARKEVLHERLDSRVDKMVNNGLLDEVSQVYDHLQRRLAAGETVDRSKGIWQSIGFRQFEAYLAAVKETPDSPQLEGLKQAGIEGTKTATRQYAKEQLRWMALQTVSSLQEENMMDRLYLLDSTNLQLWKSEVLEKGVTLVRKFLADEPLPPPAETSETAREVLAETMARNKRQDTPCRKTCEVCKKTLLTEELWTAHITSKKHRKVVQAVKRRQLIPAHARPPRALMVVESSEPDPALEERDKEPVIERA